MPSVSQANPDRRRRPSFRDRLDGWLERGILGVVLTILVWGPLTYGAVRVNPDHLELPHLYGFLVLQGLTALAVVLGAIRFFTQKPFRLLWPPICWAVWAFVLYAIVRCQTAELAYPARQNLQCVIVYAALFFVILNNLNRRESATAVAVVLIAVGLGESLFAFYQFTTHNVHIWQLSKPAGSALRGSGTYVNPDNFAGFVEMVLPLALAYTVMGRLNTSLRVVIGYGALVMMAGILFSQSRGGLIAAGVTVTVFCFALLGQSDYRRRGAIALGVLAVAALVLMQQFGAVMDRIDADLVPKNDGRILYWQVAKIIFHQNLWWGCGPGAFRFQYLLWSNRYMQDVVMNPHNDYLTTLCEWGLAGFAIVMTTLGLLIAGVVRVWPYVTRGSSEMGGKNSSRAAFVLGAALGIFSLMIHSVVDFNMQIPANAITAVTLMALLAAHCRYGTERYWLNPRIFGKILLALTSAGAVWFLVQEGVRAGKEFHALREGLYTPGWEIEAVWKRQVAALKTAHELEPGNFMTDYELGQAYRLRAWRGETGTDVLAWQGAQWFARCIGLDPYSSLAQIGYGECLDWLNRSKEANQYFAQAMELDPNSPRVQYEYAYHCMWIRDYSLAQIWLIRSIGVEPIPEAEDALKQVNEKLAEEARSRPKAP